MIKKGLFILLVLCVLTFCTIGAILFTSAGLGLLITSISRASSGMLIVGQTTGTLARGWQLKNLRIQSEALTLSAGEISCSWHLMELFEGVFHINELAIEDVEVVLPEADEAPSTETGGMTELPSLVLPLDFVIEQFNLTNGVVKQTKRIEPLFQLQSFTMRAALQAEHLVVEALEFVSPELETRLEAKSELNGEWPIEIKGSWGVKAADVAPINGSVHIGGTIINPLFSVSASEPFSMDVQGTLQDVLKNPTWTVSGSTETFILTEVKDDLPPLTIIEAAVASSGDLTGYKATITGALSSEQIPLTTIELEGNGDQQSMQIISSTVQNEIIQSELDARIDWSDGLSWQADVHLAELNLTAIVPQATGTISLDARTDGSYVNEKLHYLVEISDFLGSFEPLQENITGEMVFEGNESGVTIGSSEFGIGDGSIAFHGETGWSEHISWDAVIQLTSINPSSFNTPVEGLLNGELKSNGSIKETDINGILEITAVSGVLAGYELTGGGIVSYQQGDLIVKNLFLNNGENNLAIDGEITDHLGLTFQLHGSELTRLMPSLSGTLVAEGSLNGTREHPGLKMNMRADNLSYLEYSVENLSADIRVKPDADQELVATIDGSSFFAAGQMIEHMRVSLNGSKASHFFELAAQSALFDIQLNATGGLSDELEWAGLLKSIQIDHSRFGSYRSETESPLTLSDRSAAIDDLCLSSDSISVCSSAAWKGGALWQVDAKRIMVDLGVLNTWSLTDLVPSGLLTGAVQASGDGPKLVSLEAEVTNDELVLEISENEYYETLKWTDNNVTLQLADETLQAAVNSRFVDGSFVKGRLEANPFSDLTESMTDISFTGNFEAEIKDVRPLKVVTSSYLEPKGYLNADLNISGTIKKPRVEGTVVLEDGEIFIPQLNIRPRDIRLLVDGREDSLIMDLQLMSGEGKARAEGTLTFADKRWDASFEISGSSVELMNQTDITLVADPDLLLSLGPEGGKLSGTIVIPHALIQPEEMTGSVSESGDVIIVGDESDGSSWPFVLDTNIKLGDDVRVDGYGLTGNLTGAIDITNSRQDLLTGFGKLRLENGLVSVFERELNITRSSIIFDGGPVDNPGLDVSARKTIKAERLGEEDIVVGVNLIGTVEDYELELFSIPSMDDADIIAYIVAGTSFESGGGGGAVGAALNALGMSRGNRILGDIGGRFSLDDVRLGGSGNDDTSLLVGKRLSDDLYISYDFNLYKNAGFFTIRYDFGRGFSVESRNSMESNAINLLFSFER